MSVQARVISCSEPNRLAASRCSAVRKNSTRPSRSTGSKTSSASCTSSVGQEAGRRMMSSPQDGQLAAGHLVQGDRDRVQFGGLVVAVPAAGAEERVEVVLGADVELGVRRARQREVEEDELAALPLQRAQGQVVRLDVAVPDVSPSRNFSAWNRSSPSRSSSWMVSGPCWRSSSARVSPARYSTPMTVRRRSAGPASNGGSSSRATCESVSWPSCSRLAVQAAGGGVVQRDLEDALHRRPW